MGVGCLLLLGTLGLYGYGEYGRISFERELAAAESLDRATATARAIGTLVAEAQTRGIATATAEARASLPVATLNATSAAAAPGPTPTAVPSATAPPTPSPAPAASVIRRVLAPSIGLDAPVVLSKLEGGEWEVPKFVAGHLEGTSLPGGGGNVVLSGHVQSLTSGNVFANIEQLKDGEVVTLRTDAGETRYRISGRNVVTNDDVSVIKSSDHEEITLITCTGTYNPLKQDYTHRFVVWGDRVA